MLCPQHCQGAAEAWDLQVIGTEEEEQGMTNLDYGAGGAWTCLMFIHVYINIFQLLTLW